MILKKSIIKKIKNGFINICYLGFLRDNIEINWLIKVANEKN